MRFEFYQRKWKRISEIRDSGGKRDDLRLNQLTLHRFVQGFEIDGFRRTGEKRGKWERGKGAAGQ